MKFAVLLLLSFAVAACSPKTESAYDLLQRDTFWTLAFADAFGDGGSVTLSFIDSDGRMIHLWAQAPLSATSSQSQFFLKRTYNDPAAVEILPSSAAQQRVLELLSSYQRRSYINIPDAYPKHFAAMLQDRTRPFPRLDDWPTAP